MLKSYQKLINVNIGEQLKLQKKIFVPQISIVYAHAKKYKTNKRLLRTNIVNMIKHFNKWGWLSDKQIRQTNRILLQTLNYNRKTKPL